MPFVLDASAGAAWLLKEQHHPDVLGMLATIAHDRAAAPSLWWYEMRNVLLISERCRTIDPASVERLVRDLAALDVVLDDSRNDVLTFALARRTPLRSTTPAIWSSRSAWNCHC